MLVRRVTRGDELDFVEVKTALGRSGDCEVSYMDGIECTAEKRDATRSFLPVLAAQAVGFRRGGAQRTSFRRAARARARVGSAAGVATVGGAGAGISLSSTPLSFR